MISEERPTAVIALILPLPPSRLYPSGPHDGSGVERVLDTRKLFRARSPGSGKLSPNSERITGKEQVIPSNPSGNRLLAQWSKRVFPQQPQVHESNAQEIRECAGQSGIPC